MKATKDMSVSEREQDEWLRGWRKRGNQKEIAKIEGWARKAGMHYGQYVALFGEKAPEEACSARLIEQKAISGKPVHGWKVRKHAADQSHDQG